MGKELMSVFTYKSSIIKPNNPDIENLLAEINLPDLLVNEISVKEHKWFRRSKEIKRYEILWKINNIEYQIVMGVHTLNEVLIYLYGLHAGMNHVKVIGNKKFKS